MKLNELNRKTAGLGRTCLRSCQKIIARINRARKTIFHEALELLDSQQRMLHLAMNEAEALAWETPYPDLVFPDLAAEKIQGLANWNDRQRSLLLQTREVAPA